MSVSKCFDKATYKLNLFLRKMLVTMHEYRNLSKKKPLWETVVLTTEQKKEITNFFEDNYGRNFSNKWHRLYQSYTGAYNKDYFPEILFSTKLEPKLNNYHEAELLGDKNLLPLLFGDIIGLHIPNTFASCVRGICYLGTSIRKKNEIFEQIANIGKCVVKKTIDTSSGRDVQICEFDHGVDIRTGTEIGEVLKQFGNNWVIQELVEQSIMLNKINPTSVNTFRVITYYCNAQVYSCPVALRMGRSNADKDNIHYGGLTIGVNSDGTLKDTAFSEYGERFSEHPDTHVIFKNYRVCSTNSKWGGYKYLPIWQLYYIQSYLILG